MTKEEQELQEKAEREQAERDAALEKKMTEIANRAGADHAKRAAAKFEKAIADRDAEIIGLKADLANRSAEQPKPAGDKPPKADDGVAALRKEMEAREAAREKERSVEKAELAAQKAAALAAEERSATLEALKEIGVSGAPAQGAYLLLRDAKRLGRDEENKVVFLDPKEGYVDKLAVGEGLKKWADTDEGKSFLPPKGLGGSGNKGGGPVARKPGGQTRAERVADARAALAAAFSPGREE